MKNVLLLGASGNIAPHIIPGLEQYYNLRLADIKPHPSASCGTLVSILNKPTGKHNRPLAQKFWYPIMHLF